MNSDPELDQALNRSAQRAARHGGLLIASLARAWERSFPAENLAAALECSERMIAELSLCLRPRSHCWAADVAEIAVALGIDVSRLEVFVRKAEVIERLALAHPTDQDGAGQLMAARDRDEEI